MVKNSQSRYVENVLRTYGAISRNHCLSQYITRLAAIICNMEKQGYIFKTKKVPTTSKWGKGFDYVYEVVSKPVDAVFK